MDDNTIHKIFMEIKFIKERLNEINTDLSRFSEELKSMTDVDITDLDIAQAESEQAITDLEIEVEEIKDGLTPSNE